MKKGLLLAILAMITSVTLVGCGNKSEDQKSDDNSNTVATDTQKDDDKDDDHDHDDGKDDDHDKDDDKDDDDISLGEKTIDGESVEGTIYGTGKYRLTKGSDRVLVEWVKDDSKNNIEYIFSGDKLSSIKIRATYADEENAKATYDSIMKNENAKKGLKDLKLEGKSIIYEADESQWSDIKDYSKDQIFDEQKRALEELSKVDDIKSDD